MIKFQVKKYNDELDNALKYLDRNFGHTTEINKLLNQYSIEENETGIDLYKNNKRIESDLSEARIIETVFLQVSSEFNRNHEDNFYPYHFRTALNNDVKLDIEYADERGFQLINDDEDLLVFKQDTMSLLTNDTNEDTWYRTRLHKLDIIEFNDMIQSETGIDFNDEIEDRFGFTPDNKFLSEFIKEFNVDFYDYSNSYQYILDDISDYLYRKDLSDKIAVYVDNNFRYYWLPAVKIDDAVFDYIYDETEFFSGFALVKSVSESQRKRLAELINTYVADEFDSNYANEIQVAIKDGTIEDLNCVKKRI